MQGVGASFEITSVSRPPIVATEVVKDGIKRMKKDIPVFFQIPFLCILPSMGSLVFVELLDNPRYRKFLNRAMWRAFSWIGKAGIKHFFMTPFIAAAKNNRSEIVHFSTYFNIFSTI